jgi:hypothetical protein
MCQLWSGHSRAVPPFHWRVSGYAQGVDEIRPMDLSSPVPPAPIIAALDGRYLDHRSAADPYPIGE